MSTDLITINDQLLMACAAAEFAGYDPFDGLNSQLFNALPLKKDSLFGLAWIQFHKRSMINFRPAVGVPALRNPKGIGLFILGLLEDHKRTNDEKYLALAIDLGDWLLTKICCKKTWRHSCWGYHFDWKARAFYVPRGKPNIISTVYVSRALYALGKLTGTNKFVDAAIDSSKFIVNSLHTQHENRSFFAYIPGETAFVHNASLWGAAWVAVVAGILADQSASELALEVTRQSVAEQRIDGSWAYGSRHHHQFIDGFHTGYNLEAIDIIRSALKTNEFDGSLEKGLRYYKDHFFEPNGTVKYYHTNRYPLDMHSVAQAVLTLSKVGNVEEELALCDRVLTRALDTLYLQKSNRFIYQKTRWFTNKINYSRWTQAWAYYAIAYYNRTSQELNVEKD